MEVRNEPVKDAKDEPLDPKVEAVRRKLVRLLAVSGGVMLLGFAALIVAVLYRLNAEPDVPVAAGTREIAVPDGATVLSTAISANRVALTLRLPDGSRVIRVHDTEGRLVVEYALR